MTVHKNTSFATYSSGQKLYGDDFSESEIAEWYKDESEAYANLGAADHKNYTYGYHALNKKRAFLYLKNRTFEYAVGLGSAYGDEFFPIIHQIKKLTILDPSDAFQIDTIKGVPVTYDKPNPSGNLPFSDTSVDLITCFGVLHHIPNVTHVVQEMGRCLVPGGIVLIREPSVSMGDWSRPRKGLTSRERGIPPKIIQSAIKDAGLKVIKYSPFGFSPVTLAWSKISRSSIYNSNIAVNLDVLCSHLTNWRHRYHRTGILDRFAPSGMFWVLTKE